MVLSSHKDKNLKLKLWLRLGASQLRFGNRLSLLLLKTLIIGGFYIWVILWVIKPLIGSFISNRIRVRIIVTETDSGLSSF